MKIFVGYNFFGYEIIKLFEAVP